MRPGGLWWTNVLNSALPPWSLKPDTRPEHYNPVSHMAQKKREEKRERKKEKINKVIKILKNIKNKKVIKKRKQERREQ